jgi:probable F420-dependent oxidoreductase
MRYGANLPVGDWDDLVALRDYAQMLDEAGMDYLSVSTHILDMPPGSLPNEPAHHYVGPFREPCVLLAFLAGQTRRITLRTAVLILPLYPTALLAKQAADISIMSGGRLELGVGISWNPREYEALGQDFHIRGRRMEEQINLLRKLWSQPYVSHEGRWHKLDGIGLNQLPPRIPILVGVGFQERLLRRAARMGDGWLPLGDPIEPLQRLHAYLREEGRDVSSFQVSGRLSVRQGGPQDWIPRVRRLCEAGITDLGIFPGRGLSMSEAAARVLEARKLLEDEFG